MNPIELLKDPHVVEEIHRHLWIESEKAGHDIGLERAAEDWMIRFSSEWMAYHMPAQEPAPQILETVCSPQVSTVPLPKAVRNEAPLKFKKRRAKSYF